MTYSLIRIEGIGIEADRPTPADEAVEDAPAADVVPDAAVSEVAVPVGGKFPESLGREITGPDPFDGSECPLPETVILPDGMVLGSPGVIPDAAACPMVGRAALGSTVQPPDEAGQDGTEVTMAFSYAADCTPEGFAAAHADLRLSKSG